MLWPSMLRALQDVDMAYWDKVSACSLPLHCFYEFIGADPLGEPYAQWPCDGRHCPGLLAGRPQGLHVH